MVDFLVGNTIETFFNIAQIGSPISWGANKEFIQFLVPLKNKIIIFCSNSKRCDMFFDKNKIIIKICTN